MANRKARRAAAKTKAKPSPGAAPPTATHIAVPIDLFEAEGKILASLPWGKVETVMEARKRCKVIAATSGGEASDFSDVPPAKPEE